MSSFLTNPFLYGKMNYYGGSMSLYLDQKYALMLPLEKFERKYNGQYYANFRCPVCGDSKLNPYKKRCWFYNNPTNLSVSCFNCGYGDTFFNFLKSIFPAYYDDYIKELYFDKYKQPVQIKGNDEDIFKVKTDNLNLTLVGDLPREHPVVQYTLKRQLPLRSIVNCYYSDNFYNWCKEKQPDNFKGNQKNDARLIFPFRDREGEIFGLSGRSIYKSSVKYLTIKLIGDYPKVYGYDKLNLHQRVYVTEGQIDSLFIDNCIGVVGALGGLDNVCEYCKLNKNQIVLVIDNEKRNKQTVNFINKNLKKGYKVSLWPDYVKEKDINDMIINGKSKDEIKSIIDNNIVSGIEGLLKLSQWSKI